VNPGNLGALLNAMTWSLIWFNEWNLWCRF
jgi:hypothetical protein